MKKTGTNNGKTAAAFGLPAEVLSSTAHVCGDFNDYGTDAHPLKQRKDGSLNVTISLPPSEYQYRFLLDEGRWENDWSAARYAPNPYGSDNSVIEV